MYTITIRSPFEELWRYNIMLMCGGYDAEHRQIYVESSERIYNEDLNVSIARLPQTPPDFRPDEPLSLLCGESHSIHLILYVITHTLPEDRVVDHSPPFPMRIEVERDGEAIYDVVHEVNQWGGATIDLVL